MNSEISRLTIDQQTPLKDALSRMDEVGYKLLMISDKEGYFKGLITIGDIQRAIIANKPLEDPAVQFCRADLIIGKTTDELSDIRQQMLKYRLVYMPVISEDHKVVDIIHWKDIIKDEADSVYSNLNLPVVIMAGGLGSRLKPLTNILPKPLLPYGERTILENIIDRFRKYGCSNFSISINYKAELIKFYFESLGKKEYQIHLFTEDKPLGTAGSLHLLEDKLTTTFFVSNCDILVDEDYSVIYQYHKENKNELTLVASIKNYNIPYGTIESGTGGELITLKEKPQLSFMINCGMYVLEPNLLKEIPKDTLFHITHLIDKIKNRGGRIGVFPISEKSWVDIGEWQYYSQFLLP